jgi:microcystin-dependent protein
MTESIGNGYRTEVPSLTETANIQEALRIYHYGAPSSEYDITNTAGSNFVNPSIAYYLHDLQSQIDENNAAFDPTAYDKKGSIVTGGANGPITLELNPLYPTEFSQDGQVLTSDQESNSGMKWVVPQVTLINPVTISNKTLTNATISATGLKFVDSGSAPNFTTTLMSLDQDANKTVFFPTSAAVMPGSSTTLVGTDTTQTLTNKTLTSAVVTSGGDVVGTTATQTLTNKTLTSALVTGGGDVVGTTATQTLTNKTISLEPASNTISGILPVANGGTPAGVISQFAGSTAPSGYLVCDGAAVSRSTFSSLFTAIGTTYGTGNGSTTFNIPNFQGRVPIGVGTAPTGNGRTAKALAGTGGDETVALTTANMAAHTHSGTTGNQSADHTHSGTTSGGSTSHTHSVTVTGIGGHTHDFTAVQDRTLVLRDTGSTGTYQANIPASEATTFGGSHGHTASTGNASSDHTHTVTTGGVSANHTHNFTTDNGTGTATAHNNLQPYIVVNYIIKT